MNLPLPQLTVHELDKHTQNEDYRVWLKPALTGQPIGLLSEAGCPGVADPGALVVEEAHRMGIPVMPLIGPSSLLLALMGSGFNGQQFTFLGYLPIDKGARHQSIIALENQSRRYEQTQIFIETPYRNTALMTELVSTLQPNTRLCIATDLTLPTQQIISKPVKEWRAQPKPNIEKRPSVFLVYKQ